MDNKMIAIIAVVVLAVAGGATALVLNLDHGDEVEGSYNIIARVNAEGSGIYINEGLLDNPADPIPTRNGTPFYNKVGDVYSVDESNKNAWKGLIIGTPGATSIQHIQILTLADQMGLEVNNIANGESSEKLNYNATITSFSTAIDIKFDIDGGILWEPQYSKIVESGERDFTGLLLTNDIFPDHTCCTVIGKQSFTKDHYDVTVRFLASYIKSVEYLNEALAQGEGGDKYNNLVRICKENTAGLEEAEIKAALSNITYLYADDEDGSLSKLTKDIEKLAGDLADIKATTKSTDPAKLADALVDDTFLMDAVDYEYKGTSARTIRVAVIDGDIHQIGIRVGIELGYFEDYGIRIDVSNGLANGGAVADNVIGNQADFGFIGAPPATLKTINAGLIKV